MNCELNKTGCACENSSIQSRLGITRNLSKLSVCDWLHDLPMVKEIDIVEIRFKNTRKEYFHNVNNLELEVGEIVAVEASPGHDVGIVSLRGELVKNQLRKQNISLKSEFKKIYRKVKPADLEKWEEVIALEHAVMIEARQIALDLALDMKIGDVEFQGDKTKAIFYYIADERVDFRQLIKVLAERFKIRVEMKQIGARQEAGRIGGLASCGRELCCSTWMSNFVSVTTNSARYQELSLNPQKLAGQCGKLKCCLNFELESYLDAQKDFPDKEIPLRTEKGLLYHQKTDVFKKIMWYSSSKESALNSVPIAVNIVSEIIEQNKKGIDVPEITADMEEKDLQVIGYTNVVGQESLTRFDEKRKTRKRRKLNTERPLNLDIDDNLSRENQRNNFEPVKSDNKDFRQNRERQAFIGRKDQRNNSLETERNQNFVQNKANDKVQDNLSMVRNNKPQNNRPPENQRSERYEKQNNQRNNDRNNPRNLNQNPKQNLNQNQNQNLNQNPRQNLNQNPRQNSNQNQNPNLNQNPQQNPNQGRRDNDNQRRNKKPESNRPLKPQINEPLDENFDDIRNSLLGKKPKIANNEPNNEQQNVVENNPNTSQENQNNDKPRNNPNKKPFDNRNSKGRANNNFNENEQNIQRNDKKIFKNRQSNRRK
jgi:cell fate regulator YaaT (PSP1 superfamily)